MRANSTGVKRDNHAFAGRLYTLRHLETDVSRLRGPTCAIVPREDEKLCNAIPNCCVAMGLGEEGSLCLRHGGAGLLSAEGRGELLYTLHLFVHEGPLRTTKKVKGNCRKGNCRRSTATSTSFVHGGHEGPRRATEGHGEGQGQLQERQLQKVNGNFYFFCPRRAAKGHYEHLNTFLIHGGQGELPYTLTSFCPRRARRGAENTLRLFFDPRRARRTRFPAPFFSVRQDIGGRWFGVGEGRLVSVPPLDVKLFKAFPKCYVMMGPLKGKVPITAQRQPPRTRGPPYRRSRL